MGTRQSTPRYNNSRIQRIIPPRPKYIEVPQQTQTQPVYDTQGNVITQPNTDIQQPPMIIDTYHHNDEYVDVIGSDSGNLTVFSWITQLSTCCASLCTLIVLIAFVVWMFLNRSINALP